MKHRNKVRLWMRLHVEEYRDECGEINCTKLAEDAAQEYNLYQTDEQATIPEWVFDLAVEASATK
jgi:hypothetical protein